MGVQVNAGGREFPHHSNRERRVVSGNTLHLAFRAREGSGVQLVATSVVRT